MSSCCLRICSALAAALAGCSTSSPASLEPELGFEVPAGYKAGPADSAAELQDGWWHEFGDAVLDAVIEEALLNNRDLSASAARLQAALTVPTIVGAAALPQVDAGLDANRSRRLFLGFPFGGGGVPSSTTTTYGLSLNVRWEVDVWGRLRSDEQAALADAEAVALLHDGARLSLVGQVSKAYFAVVEARQQLALADATAIATRQTDADVRDRFRRGLRPALDAHQAATNAANADANVAARAEQLERALRQLDLLCGRYPKGLIAGADTLPADLPAVPVGLPSELLRRRPDLVAAERHLAAAGCRVDAATAALYPRLSLTASGGRTSEELGDLVDNDFRIFSLGANLFQPLFSGGALRAEVARQEALQRESLSLYQGAVLVAFTEIESALVATAALDRRRQELVRAARSAELARDLARERWQNGLTDFLAVADGQRQAFTAQSNLITAERQRLDNRIDLFLALGGGFVADAPTAPPATKTP